MGRVYTAINHKDTKTEEEALVIGAGQVLPMTIIVDKDGGIRGRILGEPEEFKEKVAPLL